MKVQFIASVNIKDFNTDLQTAFKDGWRFPTTGPGYGVECQPSYIQFWAMLVRE